MKTKAYPHITRKRTILGGIPIVTGTRTPVRSIAGYYQMGMSADEILQSLPHLTAAKLHASLAYYFDNQKEIDREIASSNDVGYWKRQAFTKSLGGRSSQPVVLPLSVLNDDGNIRPNQAPYRSRRAGRAARHHPQR